MTRKFLEFSLAQGNNLITPWPEHRFAGLKPDTDDLERMSGC